MASIKNIVDFKEEFNDLDIKQEFIKNSNEFDLPTQKVEESSLMSILMEPKWKCVKVEDERTGMKETLVDGLDIMDEYELIDITIEIPEDVLNGFDKRNGTEDTSHSLTKCDMNSENKLAMVGTQAKNDVISGNKKERRNPKRNCTKRNYTEDETFMEDRDEQKKLDSISGVLNDKQKMTTSNKSNIGLNRKSFKSGGKMKRPKDDQDKKKSTSRNSSQMKPEREVYRHSQCVKRARQLKSLEGQNERKRFQCPQCSYKFIHPHHLKVHLKIHGGNKPFHCPQCDKKFTHSSNLKKHFRIHSGVKPFHCPQCDKKFTESGSLRKHLRIHSGNKPFHCPQCDKKFKESGSLKKHFRIHSGVKPFHCSQCDKKFTQSGHLKTHLRYHSGDKPFHCSQCDKKFTRSDDLTRHLRVHSGDRPFHCPQCDKKFTQSGHLKIHLRIHSRNQKP